MFICLIDSSIEKNTEQRRNKFWLFLKSFCRVTFESFNYITMMRPHTEWAYIQAGLTEMHIGVIYHNDLIIGQPLDQIHPIVSNATVTRWRCAAICAERQTNLTSQDLEIHMLVFRF